MKRILLLITLLPFLLVGCSKETATNEVEPPTENAESYMVSFGFKGDVSITETPLSKAAGDKDLYGINVFYRKDGEETYKPYGYGLFDNLDAMTISLLTGYKYKFVCTMVVEGTSKVNGKQEWNSQTQKYYKSGYAAPFYNSYNGSNSYENYTLLQNKFIIGSYDFLNGIERGYACFSKKTEVDGSQDYNSNNYPILDRYYGETIDYVPQKEGKVLVDLKRTVFGAKFVVEGLTDGALEISDNNDAFDIQITTDMLSNEAIYTFYDIKGAWQKSDYSKAFTIHLTWNRDNGASQKLEDQQVTFKRNVMTEVKINLNGSSTDSGIGINKEDSVMSNENIDINVSGGDQTDTEVNPEKRSN